MKKSLFIAATLSLLTSGGQQRHPTENTESAQVSRLEQIVLQFMPCFSSPPILIWDARNSDIIFQNISTLHKSYNKEEIIAENSIRDYDYRPQSLYCKADSASAAFIRDSLILSPEDFEDNMPQIEDGMSIRITGIYSDGALLSGEFNTPNENQASLCYLLLHIAAQNQADSLSNEYLKYIRKYFDRETTRIERFKTR